LHISSIGNISGAARASAVALAARPQQVVISRCLSVFFSFGDTLVK